MNESGIFPNRPHKKSAWTVGEVIGKYHPHGDAAVYDTMVRLAQWFSMRTPLIDGHGNFGNIDGDGAAAMRYTESRLAKPAMELLRDLQKDTVDWQPNYDESLAEPQVLPARFPNLLVNGSSGIAVGMATNIPPHNLAETVEATCAFIDNPDITVDELMQVMPGPDFPTGALIMGTDGIRQAYETGRGSITIRAKAHVESTKTGRSRLVFTEIPYQVNKGTLQEKIAQLVNEKRIEGISDMRDESTSKGIRLVIELKKGMVPEVVLNNLYKFTSLQTTFGVNNLALVDGVPKCLSLREILRHYVDHQVDVVTRRTRYDLKKAQARAHILEGYLLALDNIDEVIHIIRSSQTDTEASQRLIERFGFSPEQTQAILEMRLRRLTGLERDKIEEELAGLRRAIAYYEDLLAHEEKILAVIKEEMREIAGKFGDKRRTEISHAARDLDVEDLIADEDMVVTITHTGYIKRIPVATYRSQKRGGKGVQGLSLKDNDFVEDLFVASTHDYVMFFTNFGKVYRLKVHELPIGSRQARGSAIVNVLALAEGEHPAAVITCREFHEDEFLMFATATGMVKKTAMSEYDKSRRDGIIAINLRDGDELVNVRRVRPGDKVILVSTDGKAILFDRPVRRHRERLRQAHARLRVPGAQARRPGRLHDRHDGQEGQPRCLPRRGTAARADARLRGGRGHPREVRRREPPRPLDAGRQGHEHGRGRPRERRGPHGGPQEEGPQARRGPGDARPGGRRRQGRRRARDRRHRRRRGALRRPHRRRGVGKRGTGSSPSPVFWPRGISAHDMTFEKNWPANIRSENTRCALFVAAAQLLRVLVARRDVEVLGREVLDEVVELLELVGLLVLLHAAEVRQRCRCENLLVRIDGHALAHGDCERVRGPGVDEGVLPVLALEVELGKEGGSLDGHHAHGHAASAQRFDGRGEKVVRHGPRTLARGDAHGYGRGLHRADADRKLQRGAAVVARAQHDERGHRAPAHDDALYVHLFQRHVPSCSLNAYPTQMRGPSNALHSIWREIGKSC